MGRFLKKIQKQSIKQSEENISVGELLRICEDAVLSERGKQLVRGVFKNEPVPKYLEKKVEKIHNNKQEKTVLLVMGLTNGILSKEEFDALSKPLLV